MCSVGHDQNAYYELKGHACPCVERLIGQSTSESHHQVSIVDHDILIDSKDPEIYNGRPDLRPLSFDWQGMAPSPEDSAIESEDRLSKERVFGEPEDDLRPDDEKLRALLMVAGLPEKKIKLVEMRLIHNLTFDEIAHELGYSSRQTAREIFNRTIESLKGKITCRKA